MASPTVMMMFSTLDALKDFVWETVDPSRVGETDFQAGLCIRIGSGFSDFVDTDPYWESGSGSRGKKMKEFQWKNALFSY
jgi:hypothetical protein